MRVKLATFMDEKEDFLNEMQEYKNSIKNLMMSAKSNKFEK